MDIPLLFSSLSVHEEIINKARMRTPLVTKKILKENEPLKALNECNEKGVMEFL